MKLKTSELSGPALDWAVAKCEGYESGCGGVVPYSTDWSQAGPLIEREKMTVGWCWTHSTGYMAFAVKPIAAGHGERFLGPTYLVAAMRAFVAFRLGDEVDVPEELQ